MNDAKTLYVGYVRKRPKLSEEFQRQELIRYGCDPNRIFDADEFEDLVKAISPERRNAVLLYRVDVLADPRKAGGPTPRTTLRARVKALRATGCPVIEVSTCRNCGDGDNMLDMVLDAYDRLAGAKGQRAGSGRPEKEMTQDQIDKAKLIWTSTQYATNAEAFEVLKSMGWTHHLMMKYEIGPSGRPLGKRRTK